MPIAGAGFGAAKALEEILGEQMLRAQMQQREQEAAARTALEQQRLAESARQFNVGAEADARKRRDVNNRQGLELMQADKAQMDTDAAIGGLPAHLKPMSGLMRIGALGKLSPQDLKSPEQAATEAKAAEQSEIRIRQASRAPQAPRERKQQWVFRGDSTTPVPIEEGTAQPGDRPYDPVAARSSQPNNPEAVDTAREAKRLASELLGHKGFGGAFGLADSYMPTLRQSTADAETLRDALTSLLTLENMNKMKGVLSDSDMKLLKQASSTINGRMSEPAAKAELQRIVDVMGKVAGDGSAVSNDPVDALIKKYGGGK